MLRWYWTPTQLQLAELLDNLIGELMSHASEQNRTEDLDRPIQEDHENQLRTLFQCKYPDKFPEEVIFAYWDMERTLRRIGEPLFNRDLAYIAILMQKPEPAEAVTFLDVINAGDIHAEDIVVAHFHKQWKLGRYLGFNTESRKVRVALFDDGGEERLFQITSIRLPSKEESELVEV